MRIPEGCRILLEKLPGNETKAYESDADYAGILSALRALDRRLALAIEAAGNAYGVAFEKDPFQGLHLSAGDVARILGRAPGQTLMVKENLQDLLEPEVATLASLAEMFALTSFELGVVLIALAPEIDLRYERLYAYLQDDVTRKKPSVDLTLHLLTASPEERLLSRRHFLSSAPLLRHRLLLLSDEPGHPSSPLLSKTIQLDSRIVDFLLGSATLPKELLDCTRLSTPSRKPSELLLEESNLRSLLLFCRQEPAELDRHVIYFEGPCGVGRKSAAEAMCACLGCSLLSVDLGDLTRLDDQLFVETLRQIVREAKLQRSALFLGDFEQLLADEMALRLRLTGRILVDAGLTFLAGTMSWEPSDLFCDRQFYRVVLPRPTYDIRFGLWQRQLQTVSVPTLEAAAAKFKFTGGQIRDAARTAQRMACWRDHKDPQIKEKELFEACRRHSNQKLSRLAQKILPRSAWNDIVLPVDQIAQLREICNQFIYRPVVLDTWGFENKLSYGKGLNVLFSGPSGTGKTMAAEVIANELQLDLYRIDLSRVVSKYIGETEKNLDRIFSEAATSNAILFFDEADALFGKRSEVKDAHDRYANIETGYLLQKMEEYDGIAILATNLRGNLDEAFIRRMSFCVEFPFPQEPERRLIWDKVWPVDTPRMAGLQLDRMAREFEISGGNIKNIALAAAFMAADDGGRIGISHLLRATRREYQKMGKVMMGGEFNDLVNN